MEPVTIAIFTAIAALAHVTISVVYVIWLTFSKIREIFSRLQKKVRVTRKDVRFITEAVKSGKHSHAYGIFDTRAGKLKSYEEINAENIEPEVRERFKETGTIILT